MLNKLASQLSAAAAALGLAGLVAAQPWTFAVFPDTQKHTDDEDFITADDPTGATTFGVPTTIIDPMTGQPVRIYDNMATWLANNRFGGTVGAPGDERTLSPILFAAHVGDITDTTDNAGLNLDEWQIASDAHAIIDGLLDYGLALGNHDREGGSTTFTEYGELFRQFFPESRFQPQASFVGVSPSGNSNAHIVTAPNGDKFGFIHIAIAFPQSEVDWANQILADNRDTAFAIVVHQYIFNIFFASFRHNEFLPGGDFGVPTPATAAPDFAAANYTTTDLPISDAFDNFIAVNPNIWAVLCGHIDGERHTSSLNNFGVPVYEILQDYQTMTPFEGNGWLRLFEVDPLKKEIRVAAYSTLEERFRTLDDQVDDLIRLVDVFIGDFPEIFDLLAELNVIGAGADPAEIDSLLAILTPTPVQDAFAALQAYDPATQTVGDLIVEVIAAATIFSTAQEVEFLLATFGFTIADLEALIPADIAALLTTFPFEAVNPGGLAGIDANLSAIVAFAFDSDVDDDMDIDTDDLVAFSQANRTVLENLFVDGSGYEASFTIPFDITDYIELNLPQPAPGAWTLAVIPDTQVYTTAGGLVASTGPAAGTRIFDDQMQFIADNAFGGVIGQGAGRKQIAPIAFASHVGDIVQNGSSVSEYQIARQATDLLGTIPGLPGGIPRGFALGNHDNQFGYSPACLPGENLPTCFPLTIEPDGDTNTIDPEAQNFVDFYGPANFGGPDQPWYLGASPSGQSSAQLITAPDGNDYLFLHIAVDTPQRELDWAQSVLDANPEVAAVLTTHRWIYDYRALRGRFVPLINEFIDQLYYVASVHGYDSVSVEQAFNTFVATNRQIALVLSGHVDGEYRQTSTNNFGVQVIETLQDYQSSAPNGGNGWLRLYEFDTANQQLCFHTYTTLEERFRTVDDQVDDVSRLRLAFFPDLTEIITDLLGTAEPDEIDAFVQLLGPDPLRNAFTVLENFDPAAPDAIGNLIVDLITAVTFFSTPQEVELLLTTFGITLADLEALLPADVIGLLTDLPLDQVNQDLIDALDPLAADIVGVIISGDPAQLESFLASNRSVLEAALYTDGNGHEASFCFDFVYEDYPVYCPGDSNLDGLVDGDDFVNFLVGFGTSTTGLDRLAAIFAGDFNEDGMVDGDDFILFLVAFGRPCP